MDKENILGFKPINGVLGASALNKKGFLGSTVQ